MSAGSPPTISKVSDFSGLLLFLWPQVTESKKKEEGQENQGSTVKVGWLGRNLSLVPLLLASPAHR